MSYSINSPASPDPPNSSSAPYRYFSTAFQTAPVLFAISTLNDGCYLDVNDAFLDTLGFTREEVIGTTSTSLNIWVDPKERSRLLSILKEHKSLKNEEALIRSKNGNILRVLFSGSLMDFGDHTLLFTLATDLKDHRLDSASSMLQNLRRDLRHSNERLALAMDISELGTFDFYPLTGKLDWDDINRKHFGVSPGSPVDFSLFLAALHPDDRERISHYINDLINARCDGAFSIEYRVIGIEDGIERWLAVRGEMFYNSIEQAVRFIGVTRDISRSKKHENTILQLNRLHAVLSAINQMVLHIRDIPTIYREVCRIAIEEGNFKQAVIGLLDDSTGSVSIAAANGQMKCIEGESEFQWAGGMEPAVMAMGKQTLFLCNDISLEELLRPWSEFAVKHGILSCASIPLRRGDTVIAILSLYAGDKNFFDVRQVELITRISTDVSFALDAIDNEQRRKEVEQALLQKEQILIHQSRHAAMGEMIGNIAHQWRQPLNCLGMLIQKTRMEYEIGTLTPKLVEEDTKCALDLVQHMSRTIEDFRNFFRSDKDTKVFSITEEIRKTLTLIGNSFTNHNITIDFHAEDDPVSCGYPNEFCQALMNIIQNAREAILEKEVPAGRLSITADRENGEVVIRVSDNAGGIPQDCLNRVFDLYFSTKGMQGNGIGLFMAKTIIEAHMNGSLTAANVADGAVFTIRLPASGL